MGMSNQMSGKAPGIKNVTLNYRSSRGITQFVVYLFLIITAFTMLVPFAWMLSSSLKLNKDVFTFPMQWIPENPRWQNYADIWRKIPLLTFILNTAKLSVIVTGLQLLSSSFAAYAFAKLRFPGRKVLFLGYIATIAVPWQAYMVPQFIMMRAMGLNNTHLSIICLQAFSAFGVFMMKQFYESVPDELREAARIDGLNEYGIWLRIMLPLSKPALSTLTIITFVNTWNDFLGPLIYLTRTNLKTIQIGLRAFISQYSSEYGLIMAASVVALIPVLMIFLSLQRYFVQGVASTGLKG
jgi:multiple sugar transport system permease protein